MIKNIQTPSAIIWNGVIYKHPLILIFGDKLVMDNTDCIDSFDTNEYRLRQSSIQIPEPGECHAILFNDDVHLFKRYGSHQHFSMNMNVLMESPVQYLCPFFFSSYMTMCIYLIMYSTQWIDIDTDKKD